MPGKYQDTTTSLDQAYWLLDQAHESSLILRLLGGLAFYIHCPDYNSIQIESGRTFSDADFIARYDSRREVHELFAAAGYVSERSIDEVPGIKRSIFTHPSLQWRSDVFYDTLEFCHDIPLQDRLEVDYPTISLADLLLSKMQIVRINDKDLLDTLMLLREHPIGKSDRETINADYIASTLRNDWGLWKTTTTNLVQAAATMDQHPVLTDGDQQDIAAKIYRLLHRIEQEPPGNVWRLRSAVGERMKWYREVDEIF